MVFPTPYHIFARGVARVRQRQGMPRVHSDRPDSTVPASAMMAQPIDICGPTERAQVAIPEVCTRFVAKRSYRAE